MPCKLLTTGGNDEVEHIEFAGIQNEALDFLSYFFFKVTSFNTFGFYETHRTSLTLYNRTRG